MSRQRKGVLLGAFALAAATCSNSAIAAPFDSVRMSSASFLSRASTETNIDLNTGEMISKEIHTLFDANGIDITEKHRVISGEDLEILKKAAERAIAAGFMSSECRKQDAIERKMKHPPSLPPPMMNGFAILSLRYDGRSDQANFGHCESPEMTALGVAVATARSHATDPAKR